MKIDFCPMGATSVRQGSATGDGYKKATTILFNAIQMPRRGNLFVEK
ncbi:MAG TPA: hypothetical protein VGI43_16395 [Mucilaginibacter sp.]